MEKPLESGDKLRCPHCRSWHPVAASNAEGTQYPRLMLFWECRGGRYYAGEIGTTSRHETRPIPIKRRLLRVADQIE